jgi:protein-S-isoprenylcysteine O-methyltransferase Ste14
VFLFGLGAGLGWLGLLLRRWSFVSPGRYISAVILVLIALIHRLRIEEDALTSALGDRYREFAAGRARLIPYVW